MIRRTAAVLRALLGTGRPPGTEARATGGFDALDGYHDLGYETDLTYQQMRSERVLDAANTWCHEYGDVLPEAWLLLDAEVDS